MKFMLILTTLLSFSAFANAYDKSIFTTLGDGDSRILGFSGCAQAEAVAMVEGWDECYRAGFRECRIVSTTKLSSKRAQLVTRCSAQNECYKAISKGTCTYRAVVKGTN